MADSNHLHLPDLTIKGFRGIDELTIRKLGRVTLLTGINGVGKTTVLEAVQTYAARGRIPTLLNILEKREELSDATDNDGDVIAFPNLTAIFHGRVLSSNMCVSIGSANGKDTLKIATVSLDSLSDVQLSALDSLPVEITPEENIQVLQIVFQEQEQIVPLLISFTKERVYTFTSLGITRRFISENALPAVIKCVSLGPGLLSNDEITSLWDTVVLTPDESQAVKALSLIYGADVSRVALVSDNRVGPPNTASHRVIVKLANSDRPVPLRSLGDGATRLFSVALALANSRDGFLLIDEAENGIHHSIQADYWRMVLKTAQQNNTQVLATTHSDDCVKGFEQAAAENEEVEGRLIRLEKEERDEEELYTVEYSEKNLHTATKRGSEVR